MLTFDQNRAVPERQPEGVELMADAVISAPVNNPQVGNASLEFTA